MGVGNAFNTALGGLNAYSQQIGYVSDNLANISTPGFKRVDASFLSYVTLSTANFHSPGGVTCQPDYRTNLAGQVSASDNPTAFAIANGVGFAPVQVPTATNGGIANFSSSPQHFTRACDFKVDNNGYLVNSGGQFLMGLKEQTTYQGNIPGTPSLGSLVGVRVDPTTYKSIPGTASTIINYNANFPATAAIGATATSQVQVYDSLGNAQTVNLVYTKVAVAATAPMIAGGALNDTASQWQLTKASIPGIAQTAAGLGGVAGPDLIIQTGGAPLVAPNDSLYFTSTGSLNGIVSVPPVATDTPPALALSIPWGNALSPPGSTTPQTVTLDFGTVATATQPASGTTQYAGANLDVRSVTDTTGQGPGAFQKATIDNNGYVVFSYSNGQQLKPYRIPLVSFSDPTKLDRVTGAVFAGNTTLAGPPVARWPGAGDAGNIVPSSIEASNIDIADELTTMIVAQRAYSSNGKVITTADEMIQEALGLKR